MYELSTYGHLPPSAGSVQRKCEFKSGKATWNDPDYSNCVVPTPPVQNPVSYFTQICWALRLNLSLLAGPHTHRPWDKRWLQKHFKTYPMFRSVPLESPWPILLIGYNYRPKSSSNMLLHGSVVAVWDWWNSGNTFTGWLMQVSSLWFTPFA